MGRIFHDKLPARHDHERQALSPVRRRQPHRPHTQVAFTFDGKPLSGFAGDTLASAVMANGQRCSAAASNITARAALSASARRK